MPTESNEMADRLIRHEEDRPMPASEHHDGGRHLTAGRPSDLGGLRAHFLQEFERAECHSVDQVRRETMFDCKNRTAEISPALVGRMSHKTRARLFERGNSKPRQYRLTGRQRVTGICGMGQRSNAGKAGLLTFAVRRFQCPTACILMKTKVIRAKIAGGGLALVSWVVLIPISQIGR